METNAAEDASASAKSIGGASGGKVTLEALKALEREGSMLLGSTARRNRSATSLASSDDETRTPSPQPSDYGWTQPGSRWSVSTAASGRSSPATEIDDASIADDSEFEYDDEEPVIETARTRVMHRQSDVVLEGSVSRLGRVPDAALRPRPVTPGYAIEQAVKAELSNKATETAQPKPHARQSLHEITNTPERELDYRPHSRSR